MCMVETTKGCVVRVSEAGEEGQTDEGQARGVESGGIVTVLLLCCQQRMYLLTNNKLCLCCACFVPPAHTHFINRWPFCGH